MKLAFDTFLSFDSLFTVSLLPFFYYAYHAIYWYRPTLIKVLDFIFRFFVLLTAAFIIVKTFNGTKPLRNYSWLEIQFSLLHILPLVLSFIIAHKNTSRSGSKGSKLFSRKDNTPRIANLGWNDLVINPELKQELMSIVALLGDTKTAKKYGIQTPKGILLSGPPGTGKTTIAKVMANCAGLSFFSISIDDVFSKWVGESEKNLSAIFQAAAKHAPSVIFIDEVDAIGRARGGEQAWAENLLNHLLQLIDGVTSQEGLYIIAATNRPELVDAALKRSGRLTKEVQIPLPDFYARKSLFHLYLSKLTLEQSLSIEALAKVTEGKSAADIKEICNQAGLNAFKRESFIGKGKKRNFSVSVQDLELALKDFIHPSRMNS